MSIKAITQIYEQQIKNLSYFITKYEQCNNKKLTQQHIKALYVLLSEGYKCYNVVSKGVVYIMSYESCKIKLERLGYRLDIKTYNTGCYWYKV